MLSASYEADSDVQVSTLSSTIVVEASRKRMKEEIALLETSARALRSRYNTLSITARLPPGVLSTIFESVRHESATRIASPDRIRWIKVTHVCTHWRRVALECPSLWADIPISNPSWVEEVLKRSKMAPLTLVARLPTYCSRGAKMIRIALTSMPRIQRLSLRDYGGKDELGPILAGVLSPAPLLESLSLKFGNINSTPVCVLPRHIFGGKAPRLRELDLQDCSLHWDSPLLRSLTSLKITSIPLNAYYKTLPILPLQLSHSSARISQVGPNRYVPSGGFWGNRSLFETS
jgi:hypothetical protein